MQLCRYASPSEEVLVAAGDHQVVDRVTAHAGHRGNGMFDGLRPIGLGLASPLKSGDSRCALGARFKGPDALADEKDDTDGDQGQGRAVGKEGACHQTGDPEQGADRHPTHEIKALPMEQQPAGQDDEQEEHDHIVNVVPSQKTLSMAAMQRRCGEMLMVAHSAPLGTVGKFPARPDVG